jgi:hypothetical protein
MEPDNLDKNRWTSVPKVMSLRMFECSIYFCMGSLTHVKVRALCMKEIQDHCRLLTCTEL